MLEAQCYTGQVFDEVGPSRRGSVASPTARQAAMPYPSPPVPVPSLPPPPSNFYFEVSKDVEDGEVC